MTKMTTLATSKPKIDDVNYKHLYHKIREHNRKLVVKMNKARRGAGFWKSQHAELMNAIWGWSASDPVSRETVWVKHPLLSITKQKKAKVRNFTFPPEKPKARCVAPRPATPPNKNPATPHKRNNKAREEHETPNKKNRRSPRLGKRSKSSKSRSEARAASCVIQLDFANDTA